MARKQLIIEFKPKGDKSLVKAIRLLDKVTNDLQRTTSIYEKELKSMGLTQKQVTMFLAKQNKTSILGIKNNRLLANSFATLRSKLLLVSFGIGLVTVGFKRLLDASIAQEKAEKKLSVALGGTSTQLLNYASALQKTTTFGDEAIIEVQALIGAFTKDEEQIKALTKATLDLAEAKGMDLTSAADLVGKSFGSSTNSLSRYGIKVDGVVGSSRRLKSLTENIALLFGGQAAAAADTLGGSVQQMTNAMGDANEAVGKAFAPIIKKLAGFLTEAAEASREFFLEYAEDPMETTIRRIEEAGGNADELKKSFLEFKKIDIAPSIQGLGTAGEMLDRIAGIEDYRLHLLGELGKEQDKLIAAGLDQEKLETIKNRTITRGMFDYNEQAYEIAIQEQESAKRLLGQIDLLKTLISSEDDRLKISEDQLKKLLEYEAILAEIDALAQPPEDEEEGGFFSRIFGRFTKQEEMEQLLTNVKQVTDAVAGVGNAYDQVKMQQINQAKQAELDTANSIRNERIRTKKIEEIEAKYAEKTKKHKEKMKDVKVMEAVSNTALGVTAALSKSPPMSFIMAALVAAQGAMQIKAIKAQKYQYGGVVGGRRHSQGGTMIEAEQGEFVMSREATEAVGIENLNRMNAGLGGGGGASIVINNPVLGKDTIEDEIVPQIKEALRRGGSIA